MNLFEVILIDFVLITFPLILYLFYLAYNKSVGKKENTLFFDVAILTSLYLIIKFGAPSFSHVPLIIINAPLIIAFYKKDILSILLLSTFIIAYYYVTFRFILVIMIIEYILYFVLYLLLNKKEKSIYMFAYIFISLKLFFITFSLWQVNYYYNESIGTILFKVFISSLILFLIVEFVLILLEKGEEILKYHMTLKELEQEKQIRTSLFKITHEIKNPLAVCKGYLDMLDIKNNNQVERYVPIIKTEIDRTLVILQDFLSITKTKINKELMDINMLIEDVSDNFCLILKQKNIDINLKLLDDEIYIDGDYNKLAQVLTNIIKNSIESIDKNDGFINISTLINRNKCQLIIEDNGFGIDNETLLKISEPFFTTKKDGTGLGVFLSKQILEAHGATINYDSKVDKGTKVTIEIPIWKEKNT